MREPFPWIWALLAILVWVSTLAWILKANPGDRAVDFKIRLTTVLSAHFKIDLNVQYRVPISGQAPSPPSGRPEGEPRELEPAEGGDDS